MQPLPLQESTYLVHVAAHDQGGEGWGAGGQGEGEDWGAKSQGEGGEWGAKVEPPD